MMDDRPHRLGFYTSDQRYIHTQDRESLRASIDDEAFGREGGKMPAFFFFFYMEWMLGFICRETR